MSSAPTILFAGGGSGGHISPALAIAERIREQDPECRMVFACSERPIDRQMLKEASLPDSGAIIEPIPARPPSSSPQAAIGFLRSLLTCRRRVREIIRREGVDRVLLLGGFVAAPALLAARAERVPAVLLNLDAPPGKANRLMARWADEVLTAIDLPMLPDYAREVVGMPVRRRALAPDEPAACRNRLGLAPDVPTLLITGASQGATSINDMMIELARQHAPALAGWQVIHLAGRDADEPVRRAYAQAKIPALVEPFLSEIGVAWGAASVAISRAGASSVGEAVANRVPTIFMPYPYHRDQHQRYNAQAAASAGGAILLADRIEPAENVHELLPLLNDLLTDPDRLDGMREALTSMNPDASDAAASMASRLLAGTGSRSA